MLGKISHKQFDESILVKQVCFKLSVEKCLFGVDNKIDATNLTTIWGFNFNSPITRSVIAFIAKALFEAGIAKRFTLAHINTSKNTLKEDIGKILNRERKLNLNFLAGNFGCELDLLQGVWIHFLLEKKFNELIFN